MLVCFLFFVRQNWHYVLYRVGVLA